MRRQADRYAIHLPVELFAAGQKQQVELQDLSRSGMFLQISPPLPVGTQIHIAMAPEGRRIVTAAKVTHSLVESEARALGRRPGVGVAFREPTRPSDELFAIAVDRLVRAHRIEQIAKLQIVIADPQTRLLERMSGALGDAGFAVTTATNGMEALAACLRKTPDVVVIDRALPVVDGFFVLDKMLRHERLSTIPVIVTSSDPLDLAAAFERGAKDFIAKPLLMAELIARARRLAAPRGDRVILRGNLAAITLPALLTMLEHERKTGRVALMGERAAWIDVVEGRITGAGSAEQNDGRAVLMSVLDWTAGTFEFSTTNAPANDSQLALPITYLLLEHARLHDEANRTRAATRS